MSNVFSNKKELSAAEIFEKRKIEGLRQVERMGWFNRDEMSRIRILAVKVRDEKSLEKLNKKIHKMKIAKDGEIQKRVVAVRLKAEGNGMDMVQVDGLLETANSLYDIEKVDRMVEKKRQVQFWNLERIGEVKEKARDLNDVSELVNTGKYMKDLRGEDTSVRNHQRNVEKEKKLVKEKSPKVRLEAIENHMDMDEIDSLLESATRLVDIENIEDMIDKHKHDVKRLSDENAQLHKMISELREEKENLVVNQGIDENSPIKIDELIGKPIELNFEIFPKGEWSVDDVIGGIKKSMQQSGEECQIDIRRIIAMKSLNPSTCYIGKENWSGYIVFTFQQTDNVILECPYEGNATYVIYGEWKGYVQGTRKDLRENFPQKYTKCVHRGEWLERVEDALNLEQKGKFTRQKVSDSTFNVPQNMHETLSLSMPELSFIISKTLKKRPNQACPKKSLVKYVLKEINVRTSGAPRVEFESLLDKGVKYMINAKIVKQYQTSKNVRLKLVA